MARKYNPIPWQEMSEFLEYDPTSKTCLRWIKKNSPNAPINIGDEAGCYHKGTGYYQFGFNGKLYGAHRIVFAIYHKQDPGEIIVDHIDQIRTNNKIDNLRLLNDSDSVVHRGGYGKSKYKGVHYYEGRKKPWVAQIRINKETKHLGSFYTEYEAAKAAEKAFIERDGYYDWPEE